MQHANVYGGSATRQTSCPQLFRQALLSLAREFFPTSEEVAHLLFGVLDGLRAIDEVIGEAALFVERELRGNAALGIFARAAAAHQARELLVACAPRNGEAVESFIEAGFDMQRGDHNCDFRSILR